jgi:hypothetical protein
MAIVHQIQPKYASRNDQIVADLRESAGAAAPIDPYVVVKRKTAELSCAMALIHGGDWRVQIDHDRGFVFVTRR